jgi:hypothetical protein
MSQIKRALAPRKFWLVNYLILIKIIKRLRSTSPQVILICKGSRTCRIA